MTTTYHIFGLRSETTPSEQSTPISTEQGKVLRFLQGESVEFDHEFSRALLAEFSAQERYRQTLTHQVSAVVRVLLDRAQKLQEQMEIPARETEMFAAGFTQGRYREASDAAQIVQDALNKTVLEAQS